MRRRLPEGAALNIDFSAVSFREVLSSAYEVLKTIVELEMTGCVDTFSRWSMQGLTGAWKRFLKAIVLPTRG